MLIKKGRVQTKRRHLHTFCFRAAVIHQLWPHVQFLIGFFLLLISKRTSWLREMCSWKASNIRSWFGSITLFRLQRSFTLSLTMSMEERYMSMNEWMNEWTKMSWDFTLYHDQYWNNINDGIVQYQDGISLSSDVSLGMKYVWSNR